MCGRYVLTADSDGLQARFGFRTQSDEPYISYNIAPNRLVPVIYSDPTGRSMKNCRWGLPNRDGGKPLINAKSETLTIKPTFSQAFRASRCIVPANGFYEWSRERGKACPHFVSTADGETFAMAGLMVRQRHAAGPHSISVVIITTDSSENLRGIHHRMPAILTANTIDMWLEAGADRGAELAKLLKPTPAELIQFHRVSNRVNNAGNDGPELIQRTGN